MNLPCASPTVQTLKKFFFKTSHRYMDNAAGLCGSQANIQN